MEWFSIRGNTQQNMAQVPENKFFLSEYRTAHDNLFLEAIAHIQLPCISQA